jgi:pimeloyl-ACP methyl ester carboxylesterase
VLFFHGHGGNRAGVVAEATALYEMGYSVVLTDFRAHGASSGNVCTIGYRESEDVYAVYQWAQQFKQPTILYGISLGAAAITKALYDHSDLQPTKVILDMPFASLKDATKGRLRLMHLPEEPMATLLVFWGSIIRGFWAFDLAPERYVQKIRCPVLLQWGAQDTRVAVHETNRIFSNLTFAENKTLVVYQQSGHQSLLVHEPKLWHTSITTFLNQ